MNNREFSIQFDILYNNISSNQAPGLDFYEKSFFLTKAQDEIIKAYFNPRLNKIQEGFDDSEKRQMDFSKIIVSDSIKNFSVSIFDKRESSKQVTISKSIMMFINEYVDVIRDIIVKEYTINTDLNTYDINSEEDGIDISNHTEGDTIALVDSNSNKAFYILQNDVWVQKTDLPITRLTVIPIDYREYTRLMSKPYKRPLIYQAWRIMDKVSTDIPEGAITPNKEALYADLVVGPNDYILEYHVRYINKPKPIILEDIPESWNLTIDGLSEASECELDEILHLEILQRAVELARAAYSVDPVNQDVVAINSQTDKGILTGGK